MIFSPSVKRVCGKSGGSFSHTEGCRGGGGGKRIPPFKTKRLGMDIFTVLREEGRKKVTGPLLIKMNANKSGIILCIT